jgi:DNA-binding winged helix-turn-helix (wHTH) protein
LRDALRDSADKPRYIQTISGRGYRFHRQDERSRAPHCGRTSRQCS